MLQRMAQSLTASSSSSSSSDRDAAAAAQPPDHLPESPSRWHQQQCARASEERDAQQRHEDQQIERLQRLKLEAAISAPMQQLPSLESAGREAQPPQLSAAASAMLAHISRDKGWTPLPLRRLHTSHASKPAQRKEAETETEMKRPDPDAAGPTQPQPQPPQSHRGATIAVTHDPLLHPLPAAAPPLVGEYKSNLTEATREGSKWPEAKRAKLNPPPPTLQLQEHKEDDHRFDGQSERGKGANCMQPSQINIHG